MKGIRVDIYKSAHGDSSHGGLSSRKACVTLLIPEGGYVDTIDPDADYVVIIRRPIGDYAVPCNNLGEPLSLQRTSEIGPMFGGTFIYSSDSRFREHCGSQPIALRDRFESEELNRMLSI